MKKHCLILFMITVFLLPYQSIQAMDYYSPIGLKVMVEKEDTESVEGFFDILFYQVDELDYRFSSSVNQSFLENHPNYSTYSYLLESDWTSFLAYGTHDAYCTGDEFYTEHVFYAHGFGITAEDVIKIVKINPNGTMEAESDILSFDEQNPFQSIEVSITYQLKEIRFIQTQRFTIKLLYGLFIVLLTVGVIVTLFLIRFGVLALFRLNQHREKPFIYVYFGSTIPFSLWFVNGWEVYSEWANHLWFWLILVGIIGLETLVLTGLIKNGENFKKMIFYNFATLSPFGVAILFLIV